ncbi:MAG: gas vesicle protein GvpG [Catenulispora sp.]
MGLVANTLGLPLLPLRGLLRIAEILRDEAERELYDPARVRRQIEEVDEARATGRLSASEADDLQRELLSRPMSQHVQGVPAASPGHDEKR